MTSTGGRGPVVPRVPSLLYFCIPQNDKLLSYWGTVEDRLYKIRHCLNIQGVFNPPALFAPPIDPLALIKATAAGLDISTALADLDAPLPFYRFTTMVQKANEFLSDVESLGAALLSALEKRDGEALSVLREAQEIAVRQAVRNIKQRQIDDSQLVIDGLQKSEEFEQIDRNIASAQVKLDISTRELANHDLQIANAQAISDFMYSKYTNQDLYDWMIGQISQTYFQAYQVALDLAKRAERCYRYEIGLDDSSFIQFAYWDSLKKGLQAGECLQLNLRRLESDYLGRNRREFECTKRISITLLNPAQLIQLRDTDTCTLTLPEELFDLDFPGHYFRRIKSLSVSIPCVAGPHTTVNATLRLLRNMVRVNSLAGSQYTHNQDNSGAFTDDERFRESRVSANAIATSSAQNDSGMFELNFRDERYLPFEGAGAISTWQLDLTSDPALRQFDYDTIADVILHVKYTSREDAGTFKQRAVDHLKNDVLPQPGSLLPLQRLFDLMHEFPTEWYAFLHPPMGAQETLQLAIKRQNFAFLAPNKSIQLEAFRVAVRTRSTVPSLAAKLDPSSNGADIQTFNFAPMDANGFFLTGRIEAQVPLDETQP